MLAAFLVLRVSSLDAKVSAALLQLSAVASDVHPADKGIAGAFEIIRARLPGMQQIHAAPGWAPQVLDQGERAYASRLGLLPAARKAFVISAALMVACFVGLACTPWLGHSKWRAAPTFVVAIVGGLVCLVSYGRLVAGALND